MNALLARVDPGAVRETLPVVLGMLPFSLLIGVTIAHHAAGSAAGLTTSALFFGGTAHLAALTMLTAGAGPPTVVAGVAAINSRLLLYAAALQPRFRDQPAWFRWLGPQLLIDQTYALATARPDLDEPARFRRYWLTAGLTMGVMWLGGHALGILVGPVLPPGLPLEITGPAVLVGLLVPQLVRRPAVIAAAVGGLVAAAASPLPSGVGTLVGAAAGLAAAALADRSVAS